MAERVEAWWARRQFSRGLEVPYPVGTYREAWAAFPMLIRQYHPELNAGITLSQIPPAADVLLLWQCETGHLFVATPSEQRARPGRERRRSAWCPECSMLANPPRIKGAGALGEGVPVVGIPVAGMPVVGVPVAGGPVAGMREAGEPVDAAAMAWAVPVSSTQDIPAESLAAASVSAADAGGGASDEGLWAAGGTTIAGVQLSAAPGVYPSERSRQRPRSAKARRSLCTKTPVLPVGEPFVSECAPRPASAVEARLRADLFARLGVTSGFNAVRVSRPFFDHVEVWPDILLPELRIAVEYDSPGRFGLEHVGKREDADRRKDRALRSAGWEVVRIRSGKLEKLGPYDVQLSSLGRRGIDRLVDAFRDVRGSLLVDAYLQ